MMTDRHAELIAGVVDDLERLTPPLNEHFLTQNGVTLDEIADLSTRLALILKGYLRLPPSFHTALIVIGAMEEADEAMVNTVLDMQLRPWLSRRISRLSNRMVDLIEKGETQ